MDVPLVNTFMGGDALKSQDENWQVALEVWPDIVRFAQDHGRKLTIENCPMIFSRDEWPAGHNIAWSPVIWRRILEQWGGTIGLNYDPSHLVWLMIDQDRFIREFGPHILHFQAKDLMIDRDGLYERGTLSAGIGWQMPRVPGLGDVDWRVVFRALYRAGYEGDCIIEHEDRKFEGTDELVKRGFLLARDTLRPYVRLSDDRARPTRAAPIATSPRPSTTPSCARSSTTRSWRMAAALRPRTTSPRSVSSRSTSSVRRPSWPARTSRSARSSASRTASSVTATKVFESQRALADGAVELDMVIDIGALQVRP